MSRLACCALLVLAACAGAPSRSPGPSDAVLRLSCNVPEAALFVDGRYLAPVGLLRGGVALAPGRHRFELRHRGHLPRLWELELAGAERKAVTIELYPVPP